MTRARGLEGDALLAVIWRTRQSRAAFGNSSGSPDTLWPIFLPLTLLFWDVNVRVTNIAAWRSASVAVSENTLWPNLNETSSRWKGLMSELEPAYYSGMRRKKYVTILMTHLDWSKRSHEAATMLEICQKT